MFVLENHIKEWVKLLKKSPSFEEAQIKEMETHLREEIDSCIREGLPEEKAFIKAKMKFGELEKVGIEVYKTKTKKLTGSPPWAKKSRMPMMLPNYLKTALRNIKSNKGYTIVNVSGLAIGLALCLLSLIYIEEELTFDRFHDKSAQIFRVNQKMSNEVVEEGKTVAVSPPALSPALKQEFPEVAEFLRLKMFNMLVNYDQQTFRENVLFASAPFFEVLSFPLIEGDSRYVLDSPSFIVINEQMANKYFGTENPIGKTISVQITRGRFDDFIISGVSEVPPSDSSIQFDFVIPYQWLVNLNKENDTDRTDVDIYNFIILNGNVSSAQFSKKLPDFSERFWGDYMEQLGNSRDAIQARLQPVTDLHLNTQIEQWANILPLGPPATEIFYSIILFTISIVVLVIASINYVTFAMGKSAQRAREVGIRKVLGAERKSLMLQFWGETFILIFIAILIAVIVLFLTMPSLNHLFGKQLTLDILGNPTLLLGAVFFWILTGLIAGIYPAIILSGFQPSKVLKSIVKIGNNTRFAKSLVIIQYVGAIALIMGVIVISKQLDFLRNQTFNVEKEQILVVKNQRSSDGSYITSYNRLKSELTQKGITQIAGSYGTIGDNNLTTQLGKNNSNLIRASRLYVDYDYPELYNHKIIEGRFYLEEMGTDSASSIVVNEAFVKAAGITNPVGSFVKLAKGEGEYEDLQIIGVIEDFHLESLHNVIEPTVLLPIEKNSYIRYLSFRFPSEETQEFLTLINSTWVSVHPDRPFEYWFLDDQFAQLYETEERWEKIISWSSAISIFIACLGLLGMTSLSVSNRKKEVGIRKIMGASLQNLLVILGKDTIRLVVIAFLIAAPLSYFLASQWLENFAYRTSIGITSFVIAAVIILFLTVLTISYHTITVALSNPVQNIKSE